jgi:hypothetical protein
MPTERSQSMPREEIFGQGAIIRKVDRHDDGSYVVRTYKVENSLFGKSIRMRSRGDASQSEVAILTPGASTGDVEADDALANDINTVFESIDVTLAEEKRSLSALLRRMTMPG